MKQQQAAISLHPSHHRPTPLRDAPTAHATPDSLGESLPTASHGLDGFIANFGDQPEQLLSDLNRNLTA